MMCLSICRYFLSDVFVPCPSNDIWQCLSHSRCMKVLGLRLLASTSKPRWENNRLVLRHPDPSNRSKVYRLSVHMAFKYNGWPRGAKPWIQGAASFLPRHVLQQVICHGCYLVPHRTMNQRMDYQQTEHQRTEYKGMKDEQIEKKCMINQLTNNQCTENQQIEDMDVVNTLATHPGMGNQQTWNQCMEIQPIREPCNALYWKYDFTQADDILINFHSTKTALLLAFVIACDEFKSRLCYFSDYFESLMMCLTYIFLSKAEKCERAHYAPVTVENITYLAKEMLRKFSQALRRRRLRHYYMQGQNVLYEMGGDKIGAFIVCTEKALENIHFRVIKVLTGEDMGGD